jgi:hypothetical protein
MTRPSTDTPLEIPLARAADGVVEAPQDETNTGPIRASLVAAAADVGAASPAPGQPTSHDIAAHLAKLIGGGGGPNGGDGSGPIDLKKLSKKNWLMNTFIALVVAGSGAFAAYKATEARSRDNEVQVERNKASIEENTKAIGEVKTSVDNVGDKLDEQYKVQVKLVEGIDTLKQEAQTDKQKRLERELEEARRELRRRRRRE